MRISKVFITVAIGVPLVAVAVPASEVLTVAAASPGSVVAGAWDPGAGVTLATAGLGTEGTVALNLPNPKLRDPAGVNTGSDLGKR